MRLYFSLKKENNKKKIEVSTKLITLNALRYSEAYFVFEF